MKKNILKSKKSFELPFGMIFSIIVGAAIIFIAIYAASRMIVSKEQSYSSEFALTISNILNPAVNGISTIHKIPNINFKTETRLYINCSTTDSKSPYFGSQTISFSEISKLRNKWTTPGAAIVRNNKYIFSESILQGKNLVIFAKPIYFGFKVDDLIILSMKDYCFINPPEEIKTQIEYLGARINVTSSLASCPKNSVKTCFGAKFGSCDINVYGECNEIFCNSQYDTGKVIKNGTAMNYAQGLIYAAIFSSPQLYECNIKRLGKKTAELARIYKNKVEIVQASDCNSNIVPFLDSIITLAENMTSQKLQELNYKASLMNEQNCDANLCRIYMAEDC